MCIKGGESQSLGSYTLLVNTGKEKYACSVHTFIFHRRIIGCDTARFLDFFWVGLLLDYALAFLSLAALDSLL